ncbi:unnamed protein product, partial [Acanthocheilonema viteae]
LHVMIFYVHKLLSAMEEQLCAGDLDSCLMDIVDVCTMDLFGNAAEEKNVSGITKDVPEARINSFDFKSTHYICSEFDHNYKRLLTAYLRFFLLLCDFFVTTV